MNRITILLILILTGSSFLFSQTELDERAVIRFDKGLGFHAPDTTFGLNLRFRIQNRLSLTTVSEKDLSIESVEARVRRLRLRIDGYAKSTKMTYYLQLSFSRSDQDFDESGFPHIIRDAMVYYHVTDYFYIGFGQGKLPGNRERITSSGHLQFTDRSLVNSIFNIDRDFGVFAYYTLPIQSMLINLKTSISSGEGRNATVSDNGLAYTGRIEFLPFGNFKNDGDFSQGDTEREPFPRLSLSASYSSNQKAIRIAGQRGKYLAESRDLISMFVDILFKYQGWAFYSEYASRNTDQAFVNGINGDPLWIYKGHGINNQISYLFPGILEAAFRHSLVIPHESIESVTGKTTTYTLGLTKHIAKHKIKLQTNINYLNEGPAAGLPAGLNRWNLQFQVEMGI
jgi:phosphate-selective porin OprO and OprP